MQFPLSEQTVKWNPEYSFFKVSFSSIVCRFTFCSPGLRPFLPWFFQCILCKIDFVPFAFPFITLITVRTMSAGIFIGITNLFAFLNTFLPQYFNGWTIYKFLFGFLTKYPSLCLLLNSLQCSINQFYILCLSFPSSYPSFPSSIMRG